MSYCLYSGLDNSEYFCGVLTEEWQCNESGWDMHLSCCVRLRVCKCQWYLLTQERRLLQYLLFATTITCWSNHYDQIIVPHFSITSCPLAFVFDVLALSKNIYQCTVQTRHDSLVVLLRDWVDLKQMWSNMCLYKTSFANLDGCDVLQQLLWYLREARLVNSFRCANLDRRFIRTVTHRSFLLATCDLSTLPCSIGSCRVHLTHGILCIITWKTSGWYPWHWPTIDVKV